MANIEWTESASSDLDEITEYIAFDNPEVADRVNQRILDHVRQLEKHPQSGSFPPELERTDIRQIVEPPCRIFYKSDGKRILILHVLRFERLLKITRLGDEKHD